MELKAIAHIENDFTGKFGIPRQSGLVPEMESRIVFEPEFRLPEAVRGIEDFSHLWLLWEFSENLRETWRPTVRPPRLGGNTRIGVFATRSPFRPNPIGLSCVELKRVESGTPEGTVLIVGGADLLSGTPIYDIKPYLSYADSHPEAACGFTDATAFRTVAVSCDSALLSEFSPEQQAALRHILENDPRPRFHADGRDYRLSFAGKTVCFTVSDGVLRVTEILP